MARDGRIDHLDSRRTISVRDGAASDDGASASPSRGSTLGRYLVLDLLGSGGMGVVYSAYDPELDRKLAIKLLRRAGSADPSRLRQEAQAMARLQHPNVVAVHDVGQLGEQSFVVMELVDGATMTSWLAETPRAWSEILRMLRQAGRGLAAAHAVGLVHRDFKLENVLIGRDGRARVVDFGLARPLSSPSRSPSSSSVEPATGDDARAGVTRESALAGTPGYLAPEQLLGGAANVRSDQFSFCVASYRALYGERPFAGDDLLTLTAEVTAGRLRPPPKDSAVPPWLRDALMRGLSTQPEQRWPSLEALLVVLARDPAQRRRRRFAAAGVALLLGALALSGFAVERRQRQLCAGASDKVAAVWNPARRQAMQTAFAATGLPFAASSFASAAAALDQFAARWSDARTDACRATRVRGEQSEELLDLRMECLDERLQNADADLTLLAAADHTLVERAPEMTASLLELSQCNDAAALRQPLRPPSDPAARARVDELRRRLARGRALAEAARWDEATAVFAPVVQAAQALGYRPLQAAALEMLGGVQLEQGRFDEALATLEQSALAAIAGRDARTEAEALADQMSIAHMKARYAEAYAYGDRGFAAWHALGAPEDDTLARLLGLRGNVLQTQGRYAEALDAHRHALAIREKEFGVDSVKTGVALRGISSALYGQGKLAEAEQYSRRALAVMEKYDGPDHPETALGVNSVATVAYFEGHYEEAIALYRRVDAIMAKTLPADHPDRAVPIGNIGDALVKLGRAQEALPYERRALAMCEKARGSKNPEAAGWHESLGLALAAAGHDDEALAELEQARATFEQLFGPAQPPLANSLNGLGLVQLDLKRPERALPPLERALAIREKGALPADLAETRFLLARALFGAHRDATRARRLAESARAAYAALGAPRAKELAAVLAWQRAQK